VDHCLQPVPGERFQSVEEVIANLEASAKQPKWLWAIPAAAAVVAIVGWYGRPEPSDSVRLAVLPVTVEGTAIPAASGLGVEVADRFSNARRGFVVIPPVETQRNRVDTVDKARTVLAATHVLRTRIRNSGGPVTLEASIIEAGSGRVMSDLAGTYAPGDVSLMAKAVTATITRAFRLRSEVPMEVLAVAAYPSYAQGLYLLRRDQSSADGAIPLLETAAKLDPRSALPLAALAEAQLQKFGGHFGPEWLERASESVAKAQSLNADSAPVLVAAGYVKQQRGWFEQAAQDFARATELAPHNADAWNHLAHTYAQLDRPSDAAATYQKAIRAQPDYYAPYLSLGLFYFNRGQFTEAEQLFRQVTVLAPGLADGHEDLGLALEQQGRFAEAEQVLLKSLSLQESSFALSNLGVLYYQLNRFDEAAQFFERSLRVGANSALMHANLGDAFRHLGRGNDAENAYKTARELYRSDIARNPQDPFARAVLARVSALLGDRMDAEFEIAQALGMGNRDERVLRQAVLVYESIGEREKTLRALSGAPHQLLTELNRQPDVADLAADPRFQEILQRN
jgi:tetratricopeptide (TPR) repeat protein